MSDELNALYCWPFMHRWTKWSEQPWKRFVGLSAMEGLCQAETSTEKIALVIGVCQRRECVICGKIQLRKELY